MTATAATCLASSDTAQPQLGSTVLQAVFIVGERMGISPNYVPSTTASMTRFWSDARQRLLGIGDRPYGLIASAWCPPTPTCFSAVAIDETGFVVMLILLPKAKCDLPTVPTSGGWRQRKHLLIDEAICS